MSVHEYTKYVHIADARLTDADGDSETGADRRTPRPDRETHRPLR